MREGVFEKSRRLLVEGRIRILEACEDDCTLSASVRSDSGREYAVSRDVEGWACSCFARGECAHIRALMLCVVFEPREVTA